MYVNRKMCLLTLMMAIALSGCHRHTVYNHYVSTKIEEWSQHDTLHFSLRPLRTAGRYESSIGLRTSSDYPFRGLTLIVEQDIIPAPADRNGQPSLTRHIVDTLNATLVEKDGTQLGKGIGLYQYVYPLRTYQLKKGDSLVFHVHHFMRKQDLMGVADVGVSLEKRE